MRDLVRGIQDKLRPGCDLSPTEASEYRLNLSALLGNCLQEILDADIAYNRVLLMYLDGSEAASRAKIRAECSPEFQRRQEARNTKELVVEMSRALNKFLDSQREEMRLGGYQR